MGGTAHPGGRRKMGTITFTQRDGSRVGIAGARPACPTGSRRWLAGSAAQGSSRSSSPATARARGSWAAVTPAEIRGDPESPGCRRMGSHGLIPSTMTDAALTTFEPNWNSRRRIGKTYMGTGNDPTSNRFRAGLGRRRRTWNHPQRPGQPPSSTGCTRTTTRRVRLPPRQRPARHARPPDPLLGDPEGRALLEEIEKSGYKRYSWRWTSTGRTSRSTASAPYTNPDGVVVENIFDPAGLVAAEHAPVPALPRQGRQAHGRPAGRRHRLHVRPLRHRRHRLRDVLRPDRRQPLALSDYEQDNAPGGSANPGQSLAFSQVSYNNLAALGACRQLTRSPGKWRGAARRSSPPFPTRRERRRRS